MARVLVTYYTKTGTTAEIAAVLAEVLIGKGHSVDARPASDVGSLEGYEAVVFGAPINGMRWLPEASAFLEARRAELQTRKVAFFVVTYLYFAGRAFFRRAISRGIAGLTKSFPRAEVAFLAGRLPSALPAVPRVLFGVKRDSPLDLRDQGAMRAWGEKLDAMLRG